GDRASRASSSDPPSRPERDDAFRPRATPPLDHPVRDREPVLRHEHVHAEPERRGGIHARPLATQEAWGAALLEESLPEMGLGGRRGIAGLPAHSLLYGRPRSVRKGALRKSAPLPDGGTLVDERRQSLDAVLARERDAERIGFEPAAGREVDVGGHRDRA